MADIWMLKVEGDEVTPSNPQFYRRYVDDIINRRLIGQPDVLFQRLNEYHDNMKLTIEINPSKYLDTNIIIRNGVVTTSVHRKEGKLPTH